MSLTEYKAVDPAKPSPLSVGTPGDKRSLPVENRFKDALEWDQDESGEGENMNETLSEAGEEMELRPTPDEGAVAGNFSPDTARELLQDLSGDDWADTTTPPLGSSLMNLASEPSNMGMVLLSDEMRKKNTFEGNESMFLNTLDKNGWHDFLSEINQNVERKVKLDDFKEELWNTVVGFGEAVLMATELDEKARGELLDKMISLREKSGVPRLNL